MVRRAETAQDLERVYAIRHQVFVLEQQVPEELERDSHDYQATHWLAWDADQAIATARHVRYSGPLSLNKSGHSAEQGKIGRVAVLPKWRTAGVGRKLMLAIHQWARPQLLILDAQLTVIPFYQKLGYQTQGEVFEECGILHQRMVQWRV